MRVAAHILAAVRGPLIAVAMGGCTAVADITPDPVLDGPAVAVLAAPAPLAADPISYDAADEAMRLQRHAGVVAADEARRDRRLTDEASVRREASLRASNLHMRACGRG